MPSSHSIHSIKIVATELPLLDSAAGVDADPSFAYVSSWPTVVRAKLVATEPADARGCAVCSDFGSLVMSRRPRPSAM